MRSTNPFLFALALSFTALSFGCNQPGAEGQMHEELDHIVSDKLDEWNDRDSLEVHAEPIESGILQMVSTAPIHGSDVERVIYFDDYGRKKRTETTTIIRVNDQRVTTTQIAIDVDGYSYKYDPEKKFGNKSKISKGFNPTQIDFTRLDRMTMEDFGIKAEGTETVAGKECVVYTINYPAMNFKGRYAVWNNLPLREASGTADFNYEYIATKLEENAIVPPSMFEVPAHIEFQENTAGQSPAETTELALPDSLKQ